MSTETPTEERLTRELAEWAEEDERQRQEEALYGDDPDARERELSRRQLERAKRLGYTLVD